MQGASRAAAIESQTGLERTIASMTDTAGTDTLADDLFAILSVLDSNVSLRRALVDGTRSGEERAALANTVFAGKVSVAASDLLAWFVTQRWGSDADLCDTVESAAVQTVIASAERSGRADQVEDELFRFERLVAGNSELRDTLSTRNADAAGKAGLVKKLLDGKAEPETIRLAMTAVSQPRGRRLDRVFETYLDLAAKRQDLITAVVTTAVPMTAAQDKRLRAALAAQYGKTVTIKSVIDPDVVGGVHVAIGEEVIDGTIARRLDQAKKHVAGS